MTLHIKNKKGVQIKMRKIIALTLVIIIIAFALTACGGGGSLTNSSWTRSSSDDMPVFGGHRTFDFRDTGTLWVNGMGVADWSVSGDKLTVNDGTSYAFTFKISGDTLTITYNNSTSTLTRAKSEHFD